jgi:hypothetical protein
MWYLLRVRRGCCVFLIASLCAFITAPTTARKTQRYQCKAFTGYPPSVYTQFFQACSPEKPCTRTDDFRVDPLPKGCCIMLLTNGDGKGNDEVHAYEVFLNGKRFLPEGDSRNAQAAASVQASNKIKLVLTGKPDAKVFVLISRSASVQVTRCNFGLSRSERS